MDITRKNVENGHNAEKISEIVILNLCYTSIFA